jgi:hypothetical protein
MRVCQNMTRPIVATVGIDALAAGEDSNVPRKNLRF